MKTANLHTVLKTVFLLGVIRLTMATDSTMKTIREDDAVLRTHIKQRLVATEKVAPIQFVDGEPKIMLNMSLSVISVVGLTDASQMMRTAMYLALSWSDPLLAWDPANYSGIIKVQLPTNSAWTPDLRVVNSAEQTIIADKANTLYLFFHGSVWLVLPLLVNTQCIADLTYYPYDEQKCNIDFHSFHSELKIKADLDHHTSSVLSATLDLGNEWDIKKSEILEFSLPSISDDMQTFPSLVVTVKRRSTFYTMCLVLPMVLTSYMNTLVFLLPLQSGEKISFLVSIFVSTSVFISYFTNMMPRGLVKMPIVMKLMIGVLIESVLIFLATILVLRQYQEQKADDNQASRQQTREKGRESTQNETREEGIESSQNDPSSCPTTLKDSSDGCSLLETLCCGKWRRLIPTDRVSSAPVRSAPDATDNPKQTSIKVKKFLWNMKANCLDNLLFVLAFVGNSVFVGVMLTASQMPYD